VPTGPALAVAGIAQPDRFFQDLRAAGWPLCGQIAFADHHPYSRRDLDRIVATARERGADLVVTTEKDLVRLLRFRPFRIRFASVPLLTTIEPEAQFDTWLVEAIQKARRGRP
jgi:tetraacyldisaccharide 4'-kinase